MGRTVQGTTIGGDFVVSKASEEDGLTYVRFEMPGANAEHAEMDVTVATKRFRRAPEVGDRHRIVVGLEPLDQDDEGYGEPREVKVGVPISLLVRARDALGEGETAEELDRALGAIKDYLEDAEES